MTNITILQAVYSDLASWAGPLAGEVSASGTFVESMEVLLAKPTGFLVIIEWQGEEASTEDEWTGVMRAELGVYVAVNVGLQVKPGAGVWMSPAGRTLLERTNAVRDRIREITFPDDQDTTRIFNYRGSKQVLLPDGTPLRAFRLEYDIHYALPEVDCRNVNP